MAVLYPLFQKTYVERVHMIRLGVIEHSAECSSVLLSSCLRPLWRLSYASLGPPLLFVVPVLPTLYASVIPPTTALTRSLASPYLRDRHDVAVGSADPRFYS